MTDIDNSLPRVPGQLPGEAEILEWLGQAWQVEGRGRGREFPISPCEWAQECPALLQILQEAERQQRIDLIPDQGAGKDEGGNWLMWTVRLRPGTVQILHQRRVHRQVTVDGEKIDLRSIVGRMLFTASIANLADACRLWLADLKNERKQKTRTSSGSG
jgi:hypothetical protein